MTKLNLIQSTALGLHSPTLRNCSNSFWSGFDLGHSQTSPRQSKGKKSFNARTEAPLWMSSAAQQRYRHSQLQHSMSNQPSYSNLFSHMKHSGVLLAAAWESQFIDHGRLVKDRV